MHELLGVGIYTRAQAARILNVSPRKVSRWVRGYTYRYQDTPRRRGPVAKPKVDLPSIGGDFAISFLELVELQVIAALVSRPHISLQRVRIAAEIARQDFKTERPFAMLRVFTDGAHVFAALSDEDVIPDLVQLSRDRHLQVASGHAHRQYVAEIKFNEDTKLAERWWPLGRGVPIVIDPNIALGAPVIEGTRLRTSIVADMALGSSVEEAAFAYRMDERRVRMAIEYERSIRPRAA